MTEERFTLFRDGEEYGDYSAISYAKCGMAQAKKRWRNKDCSWKIHKRVMTIVTEEEVWSDD